MSIESYIKVKHEHKRLADKSALRKAGFRKITEQRIAERRAATASQEPEITELQPTGDGAGKPDKKGVGSGKRTSKKGKPS